MRRHHLFTVAITAAVVSTIAVSCSNAPSSANTEPQASTDSVVVTPTKTHGVVRGFVRDVETNDPIRYANVMIVGTTLGAVSVKSGEFAISGVVPGIYQMRAMMMGYNAATIDSVIVSAGARVASPVRRSKQA